MAKRKPQSDRLSSLTQKEAAKLLGVTARSLRDWDAPRNSDGSYNGPALVKWRIDSLIGAERERLAGDDAVMIGGDSSSPAMERWRRAKAEHAELDLAARRGELVPADTAVTILSVVAARIRRMGERLTRKHGPAVAESIDDALTDAESDLERAFGSGGEVKP